jgi:dihydrofolate reductase
MRTISAIVFQSLDGVMQAPGGPPEDPTGGFRHGGWMSPVSDDVVGAALGPVFATPCDLLLGRKTYDIFAAHWPYVAPRDPVGIAFNKAAKYVVTRGADPLLWHNSHRLGDVAAVADLKAGDGPDLMVWGSSTLHPQLLAAGLIDRLTVMTFPVVLGQGKRLFGDGTPPRSLTSLEQAVTPTGVIIATYAPAGPVKTAFAGEDHPSAAELERRARIARDG